MKIPYLLTKSSITLHYEGKTKVVAQGDERFDRVIAALRADKHDEIPEIVEPELYFRAKGLDLVDGLVMVKGEAMPPELNGRIAAYQANGLPFASLMKFWANLKKNPSFNSRQQLFKFLENKGHSITDDGCFIGYRGVTEDFKDCHSETFNNAPGAICEMDRAAVDDNPNNTCSHGLHVGGYDYAKDFGANGKLVMVKVNPADVVAVPNDYNGQKMRVCKFEVLKETTDFLQKHVVGADGSEDAELSDDSDFEDDFYGEDDEEGLTPAPTGSPITGAALKAFELTEEKSNAQLMAISFPKKTAAQKRKHKARYANNHAKRGKNGKFIAKKKAAKKPAKKTSKRSK